MPQALAIKNISAISIRVTAYMICFLLLVTGAGMVILHVRGRQLLSVQSDSMTPTFKRGDALVVEPVSLKQIQVGSVVSYHSPGDQAVIVSHRVTAIDQQTGWLTTAGDRLGIADRPFPANRLVGRATAIVPGMGRVIDAVRTPLGLAVMLYLPAAIVIYSEIRLLAGMR